MAQERKPGFLMSADRERRDKGDQVEREYAFGCPCHKCCCTVTMDPIHQEDTLNSTEK